MENRSFDHLLSNLPASGQPDVEVATADATNPDATARRVPRFHLTEYCFDDTDHTAGPASTPSGTTASHGRLRHRQQPQRQRPADGKRAMGYYTEQRPAVLLLAGQHLRARRSQFLVGARADLPQPRLSLRGDLVRPHRQRSCSTTRTRPSSRSWSRPRSIGASTTPICRAGFVFLGTLTKYIDNTYKVTNFFTDAQAGKLRPAQLRRSQARHRRRRAATTSIRRATSRSARSSSATWCRR